MGLLKSAFAARTAKSVISRVSAARGGGGGARSGPRAGGGGIGRIIRSVVGGRRRM